MVEDISRFAFAEGSFGAGELNGQLRIDRRACADIDRRFTAVGFHAIPALWERDMRKAGYGYFSEEPALDRCTHNEGGTIALLPHTVCVEGVIF